MTLVKIKLDVKDATWIAANPTKVLALNEPIYRNDGLVAYGDGITPLSGLTFLPLFSSGGIQSITGTTDRISIDNTDPLNPILDIAAAYDAAVTSAINNAIATKANIAPRVDSMASSTSYTLNLDAYDQASFTALSGNITINAPTGTVENGRTILYRFVDNGTARMVTLNSIFVDLTSVMFTTTTIGKACIFMARYSSSRTKYEILAVVVES